MSTEHGEAAYEAMKALDVTKIVAHFQGGNDEGGYDQFTFYNGETELGGFENFDAYDELEWDHTTHAMVQKQGANEHRTAIGLWLTNVLNESYGGFAGDFFVDGNVTLDADKRSTIMDGTEEEPVGHPIARSF